MSPVRGRFMASLRAVWIDQSSRWCLQLLTMRDTRQHAVEQDGESRDERVMRGEDESGVLLRGARTASELCDRKAEKSTRDSVACDAMDDEEHDDGVEGGGGGRDGRGKEEGEFGGLAGEAEREGGLFVDGVVAACTRSHAPLLTFRSWQ